MAQPFESWSAFIDEPPHSLEYAWQFISENHPMPFPPRANDKIKAGMTFMDTI
jgi:hypothetical protein